MNQKTRSNFPLNQEGIARQLVKKKAFSWRPFVPMPNPGKYEDLQKEFNDVLMNMHTELFDGFQFNLNRQINPNFGVMHSINMGQTADPDEPPASYSFASSYQRGKEGNHSMLFGRINTEGTLMARWHHDLTERLQLRISAQLTPEEEGSFVDAELNYKGSDYYAQFKHQNKGGLFRIAYSQAITTKLMCGVEGVYLAARNESVFSGTIRYLMGEKEILTFRASTMGTFDAAYTHVIIPDKLSLCSCFSYAQEPGAGAMSMFNVGYQYKSLPFSTVKGSINTMRVVSAFIEEQVSDVMGFVVCGQINYPQNLYRFGFGIHLSM